MVDERILRQSNELLAGGRAAEAFSLLVKLASDAKQDWELSFLAGQAGLAAREPQQALGWLEIAFRGSPGPVTHYFLAVAQSELGLHDYARRNLERAIRLAPTYWEAHYQLGLVYEATGDMPAAETAYRAATILNPAFPDAINNLSNVLRQTNRMQESREALERVLKISPSHPQALFNLAQFELDAQKLQESEHFLRRALTSAPADLKILKLLARVLHQAGRLGEAAKIYRDIARLDPSDRASGFVSDYLEGVNRPQPPEDFVVQLMDDLAPRFDQHLVGKLQYTAPERIGALVKERMGDKLSALPMLDLGCGTGLVGSAVKPYASRLVGVDLSPKMLEAARAKGVYDELQLAEMQRYLNECDAGSFDLVIAADAFVYVGDLQDVFKGIRRALKRAGGFVFTIEVAPSAAEEYFLQNTGRYRHSEEYVAALARQCGMDIKLSEKIVLRMERDMPVPGAIIWMA